MKEVDEFIEWAMSTNNNEVLHLTVEEYYLKRQLAKEI
jgi:hypothetical protein